MIDLCYSFSEQRQPKIVEEWKSFSLPSVSTLAPVDLKSQKPALKHLRKQFYISLLEHLEADQVIPGVRTALYLEFGEKNMSQCTASFSFTKII